MAPAYRRRYGGALGLLPLYLPLARLTPDVVHFEWEDAADGGACCCSTYGNVRS